jgi:filamentous hemagglutinin family protein
MNKSFHSIWNASKQTYVAAAETVSAKGKPSSGAKVVSAIAAILGGLLAQSAYAQTAPPPNTLPTGGQVGAGKASIGHTGANMVIQQSTDRAAINWQSFNVGKDAKVQFVQPSASSVTLNRVLGNDPSQIFGQITANGQVILSNPSGVFFGKDARVDVGGLIATTHGIGNADFMAGKNRFERNDSTASVVNEGELKATLGGYIALLAPEVRNQGAVIAHMGTVAMAAGEAFDLKFDSNNRLTSLRVTPRLIEGELAAIQMAIDIEDGQIQDRQIDTLPTVRRSTVSTQAIVRHTESLLIAGYITDQAINAVQKVPLLGNLPVVGPLFSTRSVTSQKRERLFLIRPRLVGLGMAPPSAVPGAVFAPTPAPNAAPNAGPNAAASPSLNAAPNAAPSAAGAGAAGASSSRAPVRGPNR